MKPLFISLSIALIGLSFIKQKEFIPPGTVQINDTLYADETEITNSSWLEFEQWTAGFYGKNSKEYLGILPDSTVWIDKLTYNMPYVQYYYRHPAYKDYPVVGISYEQAKAFCIWRTARVKYFLSIKKEYKNQNFEYRLPNKAEWELFAAASLNVFENKGFDEKGNPKLNCIMDVDSIVIKGKTKAINFNSDVTAPVDSYYKNRFGLYNMIGNVSEMIEDKGICKGGAWNNRLEQMRIGNELTYIKPSATLGFRCVCIVKKNKMS
jgi:formylglycine-generating enzyme required for sulfatase activity